VPENKDNPLKEWVVKDTDGETVSIRADTCELLSDGLFFYLKNKIVAHFTRFSYYMDIEADKDEG